MEYIAVKDIAEKWGITRRRVEILCVQDRVSGAYRLSRIWVIPSNVQKPFDGGRKEFKENNFINLVNNKMGIGEKDD